MIQEGGRDGDGVSNSVGEVPWIPKCEMIYAGRREGGGLISFPSRKREDLDVGILRIGAIPATLKVASRDKEVVR